MIRVLFPPPPNLPSPHTLWLTLGSHQTQSQDSLPPFVLAAPAFPAAEDLLGIFHSWQQVAAGAEEVPVVHPGNVPNTLY